MSARASERGSVLVAVLWLVAMLGVFAMAVSRQASQELLFGQWMRDRVLGRALAKAAIQRCLLEIRSDKFEIFDAFQESWGSNPGVFKNAELTEGSFSVICEQDGDKLYGACDEASRINLNKATAENLRNLLLAVEPSLENEKVDAIADSIVDWRDKDSDRSTYGAESRDYHSSGRDYDAANADLTTIEELSMINGVTPELYAKLKPFVTVYTDGTVNFNTAPKIVLMAMGLSEALASRLVDFRKGADQILGTEDDEVFQDAGQVISAMSSGAALTGEEYSLMNTAVSGGMAVVKSDVFRIRALGALNREGRTTDTWITCVMKRDGMILSWKEGQEA